MEQATRASPAFRLSQCGSYISISRQPCCCEQSIVASAQLTVHQHPNQFSSFRGYHQQCPHRWFDFQHEVHRDLSATSIPLSRALLTNVLVHSVRVRIIHDPHPMRQVDHSHRSPVVVFVVHVHPLYMSSCPDTVDDVSEWCPEVRVLGSGGQLWLRL